MRTLFLQAPSFDGFDGGAGSRYQARREIRSYWYPTWLAQAAALVPGSKLVDAVPHSLALADMLREARHYDLAVLHTSTPSFASDIRVVEALKAANPGLKAGFVGAKVAVEPDASLPLRPRSISSPAMNSILPSRKSPKIATGAASPGCRIAMPRARSGTTRRAPFWRTWTSCRSSRPVYKRDLTIEKYFIGYLKHPYVSLYTGRGCKSRCTFCLWPQTVGGHRYRTRSVGNVVDEIRWAQAALPQVKEFFFDDDTFTDDRPRTEAIARELGKLGVTWSCNAKANVPRDTLKVMRDNGLRLLLVGYETGNQQILHNIRKGMRIDVARRFTKDCHELGITIHGTFILGLPGESRETIEETIRFATEINPHTIQVSHRRALSGNGALSRGTRAWLARRAARRPGRCERRADRPASLSAFEPHRDLPVR